MADTAKHKKARIILIVIEILAVIAFLFGSVPVFNSGNIAGTFFNDFMGQARNSSDAVLEYIKGGTVPFEMLTEYVCVTIDNAQELLDVSASGIEEDSDEEESEEESEE